MLGNKVVAIPYDKCLLAALTKWSKGYVYPKWQQISLYQTFQLGQGVQEHQSTGLRKLFQGDKNLIKLRLPVPISSHQVLVDIFWQMNKLIQPFIIINTKLILMLGHLHVETYSHIHECMQVQTGLEIINSNAEMYKAS